MSAGPRRDDDDPARRFGLLDLLVWATAVLLALALVRASMGCVSARDAAIRQANVTAELADTAEAVLADLYEREQRRCLELPAAPEALACVAVVRRRYGPAWDAHDALRAAWLLEAAVLHAAEEPDPVALGVAAARLEAARAAFARAVQAIAHDAASGPAGGAP